MIACRRHCHPRRFIAFKTRLDRIGAANLCYESIFAYCAASDDDNDVSGRRYGGSTQKF